MTSRGIKLFVGGIVFLLVISMAMAGGQRTKLPRLDLDKFVGSWHSVDSHHPELERVVLRKLKPGMYLVKAWGSCGKQAECVLGQVKLSNDYPHGLAPWDPKYKMAFVGFRQIGQQDIGVAVFNVFTAATQQPNKLLKTMMVRA